MQLSLGGNQQGLMALLSVLGKQLIPELFKQLTVSSTAVALPDIPEGTVVAHLTIETTQSLRYTVDGTIPTTTVGHLLANNQILELVGSETISKFQAIEASAGTSK